jgi:hypothetical protein
MTKEEKKIRVCGSADAHSKVYNKPTMDCIKYLRARIQELEKKAKEDRESEATRADRR